MNDELIKRIDDAVTARPVEWPLYGLLADCRSALVEADRVATIQGRLHRRLMDVLEEVAHETKPTSPPAQPTPIAWAVLWPEGGRQQHMMFPSESSALSWALAHPVACLGRVVPVYAGVSSVDLGGSRSVAHG